MLSKHGFETTIERSLLMSKIKSSNTKSEIILRKALWNLGYRYRIHSKKYPGKPDIVFKKKKVAIFIDGEFWHGYNWEEKKLKIKSNPNYWIRKIERNMTRDRQSTAELGNMGFTVIRFWEQDIKKNLSQCISKIVSTLDN